MREKLITTKIYILIGANTSNIPLAVVTVTIPKKFPLVTTPKSPYLISLHKGNGNGDQPNILNSIERLERRPP